MVDKRIDSIVEKMNKRKDLVFETLNRESDRGVILVGTMFLDEGLEGLIRAKFQDKRRKIKGITNGLFGPVGPLGTFWAKIRLAYALDLIAAYEYRDLELLRTIRNRFAHKIEAVGFADTEVMKLAERLESPEVLTKHILEEQEKEARVSSKSWETINCTNKGRCARWRIYVSIGWISGRLHAYSEH